MTTRVQKIQIRLNQAIASANELVASEGLGMFVSAAKIKQFAIDFVNAQEAAVPDVDDPVTPPSSPPTSPAST